MAAEAEVAEAVVVVAEAVEVAVVEVEVEVAEVVHYKSKKNSFNKII